MDGEYLMVLVMETSLNDCQLVTVSVLTVPGSDLHPVSWRVTVAEAEVESAKPPDEEASTYHSAVITATMLITSR